MRPVKYLYIIKYFYSVPTNIYQNINKDQISQIFMNSSEQQLNPYFYYNCQGEVMTLDTQYSPTGNYLAFSYSNGAISIYQSSRQMTSEEAGKTTQFKYINENHIFLKMAWSYIQSDILFAVSISKYIFCLQLNTTKQSIECLYSLQTKFIPIYICLYPSQCQNLVTIGFAGGQIAVYNDKLQFVSRVISHAQGVNWLSWEVKVNEFQRNQWVKQYDKQFENQNTNSKDNFESLLLSGASDGQIKVWKLNPKSYQLIEIHSFDAHSRQIRQVMWRPRNNCIKNQKKGFVSCSQDGIVRFWNFYQDKEDKGKININLAAEKSFGGAVYRAEYNHLGTLIAIRHYKSEEQKVETRVFKDVNGVLGEQVLISQNKTE